MVCGNCGATIAEKAIVCYRCGTATARPPVPGRPTPAPVNRPWLAAGAMGAAGMACAWLAIPAEPSVVPDAVLWVGAGMTLVGAAWLAIRR